MPVGDRRSRGLRQPGQRLDGIAATTDGFELSRLDLENRREGDVLGASQSGRRSSLRLLSVLRDEEVIATAREEATALWPPIPPSPPTRPWPPRWPRWPPTSARSTWRRGDESPAGPARGGRPNGARPTGRPRRLFNTLGTRSTEGRPGCSTSTGSGAWGWRR